MRHFLQKTAVISTVAITATAAMASPITITGLASDQSVEGGGILIGNDNDPTLMYGRYNSYVAPVLVFELPDLPSDTELSTADLSFHYKRTTDSQSNSGDLYGLSARNSPTVLGSDYSASATLLQSNIIVADLVFNGSRTAHTSDGAGGGDEALTDYLNAQLAATATQRALGQTFYVFLRLNPDSGGAANYRRYYITPADAASDQPTLTYETQPVPEPAAIGALTLAGLLFVRRRRRV